MGMTAGSKALRSATTGLPPHARYVCNDVPGNRAGWFYCNLCDCSVPTAMGLQEHTRSEKHKASLELQANNDQDDNDGNVGNDDNNGHGGNDDEEDDVGNDADDGNDAHDDEEDNVDKDADDDNDAHDDEDNVDDAHDDNDDNDAQDDPGDKPYEPSMFG